MAPRNQKDKHIIMVSVPVSEYREWNALAAADDRATGNWVRAMVRKAISLQSEQEPAR